MRKLKLTVEVELNVGDDTSDEAVCQAICNQFTGCQSFGLTQWSGSGEVVSATHTIDIYKDSKNIWWSRL